MCVIEAVSGEHPWTPYPNVKVKSCVRNGHLPNRPARFQDDNQLRHTDKAWELVLQMCCFQQEKRPSAAEVAEAMSCLSTNSYDKRHPYRGKMNAVRP